MSQIVQQAEAERVLEVRAAQRAEWFGRVRSAFVYLFIATVLIFGYTFHDRMGDLVATVMPAKAETVAGTAGAAGTSGQPAGKAQVALQGASQNAAVRDQLVDALAK